jgi:E3 ubiquitin-protein ligase DOA10
MFLVCAMQYAHRACVQRWCNEKGDVTCEICHEVIYSMNKACGTFFHGWQLA